MKRELPANFKVVCAHCQRHLAGRPEATTVSHGVCGSCYRKEMRKAGIRITDQKLKNPHKWHVYAKKTGRPRGEAKPRLFVVKVFSRNNKGVLKLYTYANSAAEAIRNTGFKPGGNVARIGAAPTNAKNKTPFQLNPAAERRAFDWAMLQDPFYQTLIKKAALTLRRDLQRGSFDRKRWFRNIVEPIVARVTKEQNLKLNRRDALRVTIAIARYIWRTYVAGKG